MKNKIDKELAADIRNKLQASMTALERLKAGNMIPKKMLELAVSDLSKILEMLNKE